MTDNPGTSNRTDMDPDDEPDPEAVATRAEGRPPEEASSDDPTAQALTILEESEERTSEGAAASEDADE